MTERTRVVEMNKGLTEGAAPMAAYQKYCSHLCLYISTAPDPPSPHPLYSYCTYTHCPFLRYSFCMTLVIFISIVADDNYQRNETTGRIFSPKTPDSSAVGQKKKKKHGVFLVCDGQM